MKFLLLGAANFIVIPAFAQPINQGVRVNLKCKFKNESTTFRASHRFGVSVDSREISLFQIENVGTIPTQPLNSSAPQCFKGKIGSLDLGLTAWEGYNSGLGIDFSGNLNGKEFSCRKRTESFIGPATTGGGM